MVTSNSVTVVTGSKTSPSSPLPVKAGSADRLMDAVPAIAARNEPQASAQAANLRIPTTDELKKISQEMQRKIADMSPELQFSVDKDSGQAVIKVTNRVTNELVRQIPSEEALQLANDLAQFRKGLLLNQKV